MRVLISADMEGATGVTWPADVEPGTEQWQRCRRMFTSDVNAAIAGFLAAGADEVLVNEAHSTMRNLLLEELDPRAVMLTGRHKELSMIEGIQDEAVQAVAFLGYHAPAGADGVLAHTYLANSITSVRVNGQTASEGWLNAQVAAEYGVPVVLVTGDDRACADAAGYAPQALTVAVKQCVSRYAAICQPPEQTAAAITAAAIGPASSPARGCQPHPPADGYTVEIEVDAAQLAQAAAIVPTVRRTGERTVRYLSATGVGHDPLLQDGHHDDQRRDRGPLWLTRGSAGLAGSAGPGATALAEQEVVTFAADLIRIDTSNRGWRRLPGAARRRVRGRAARGRGPGAGPAGVGALAGPTSSPGSSGPDRSAGALLAHGHLDVVPAEPADWSRHPFSGEIADGVLHGRGAVDMKNADATLDGRGPAPAAAGLRPRRDIVLAFTADEEDTAAYGAGWLVQQRPDLFEGCTEAIGESGAFTFHAGNGLRLYPVASAERGTAWLKLTARGRAGHGSKANPDNAVARIGAAVARIAGVPVAGAADPDGAGGDRRDRRGRRRRTGGPRRRRGGRRDAPPARAGRGAGAQHGPQQREPDDAGGGLQGQRDPGRGDGVRGRPGAARLRRGIRRRARRADRPARELGVPAPRDRARGARRRAGRGRDGRGAAGRGSRAARSCRTA